MMDAFSSNAENILQRSIEVTSQDKHQDVGSYLELERCRAFITENKFETVALQFPDKLLWCSAQVASFLTKNTAAKCYILGDTSYGSCCVDEVAAQHIEADCIIHFGRSCLSPTTRLPVLYIFGRETVDVSDVAEAFRELLPGPEQRVIVLYDVAYAHIADLLGNSLNGSSVVVSEVATSGRTKLQNETKAGGDNHGPLRGDSPISANTPEGHTRQEVCGRIFHLPSDHNLEEYSIFYIGGESLTLKNLMITLNKCPFYSYDPQTRTRRRETLNVNKTLMKRYYMIERAKDAQIVGIIVGTLGVANYLDILSHLKAIMKKAGKKYYTFAVGKLNVAKLANFMEVEVYVLVACPENTLIDSKEFFQPVVTPFEMEVACNQAREWTGEYTTDFRELLPGADKHVPMPESVPHETDVSLITGRLRSIGTSDDATGPDEGAVVERDQMLAVVEHNTAGEYLSTRSWQGLQAQLGQTEVKEVVEGTRGIAASYTHEEGTPV